jgi:hypothetical protein
MRKFALIYEGITDYLVLKELLYVYFKDEEIKIIPISPSIDETDKQSSFGGWKNVINRSQDTDFLKEILLYNDIIIIQIDTDIAENEPLNIHLHNIENNDLCNKVQSKLKEFISDDEIELDKFIFAIGIHTIECWLVGLLDNNHTNKQVNNCINRLNRAIRRNGNYKRIPEKKENAKETYSKIASLIKKKKDIEKYSKKNVGFESFINQLNEL